MTKLFGFSIYPEKSTRDADLAYIRLCAKYGYKRMFTCFLSVDKSREELISEFKPLIHAARELGIETYVDVYSNFFTKMGISLDDLSFFNELEVAGFRLDRSFSGSEESLLTYNPFGLKIEVNISNQTSYVQNILDYEPNMDNLIGCHNFYPQRYSGLDTKFFVESTKYFHSLGLHTAAFVTSQTPNTFGPWNVSDKQPTLERDRDLPIDLQARRMWATAPIDDIIISNAYASENELATLAKVRHDVITLTMVPEKDLSQVENSICFDQLHYRRGDISAMTIRSTATREKYRLELIEPRSSSKHIEIGDVIVGNADNGIYSAELQIALRARTNDGRWNLVGHVPHEEIGLLDAITPWKKFVLQKKE